VKEGVQHDEANAVSNTVSVILKERAERKQKPKSGTRFLFMENVAKDGNMSRTALRVAIYVHKRCYGQDEFDISIRDCARFLNVERNTAKRGFAELLSGGHLERLPDRTTERGRKLPARFRFKTRTAVRGEGVTGDPTTTVVSKKKRRREEGRRGVVVLLHPSSRGNPLNLFGAPHGPLTGGDNGKG
jgi:hypothetical protein